MSYREVAVCISPYPAITADGRVVDGTLLAVPPSCERCPHKMCRSLSPAPLGGFRHDVCSEGLSTFSCNWDGDPIRFVGLMDLQLNSHATAEVKKAHRQWKVSPGEVATWFARMTVAMEKVRSLISQENADLLYSLHEVKTACNAVIRNAEVLVGGYSGDSFDQRLGQAPDEVKALYSSAQLLIDSLELSSILLNPKAITATTPHAIKVYSLFFKYVKTFRSMAEARGLRVSITGNSIGETLGYDALALIPVILIHNAIKYGEPGTDIVVHVTESASATRASIKNVGPVLPPSDMERIFEKGGRASAGLRPVRGHGIGLYIAKLIASAHDTIINVSSVPDPLRRGLGVNEFSIALMRYR